MNELAIAWENGFEEALCGPPPIEERVVYDPDSGLLFADDRGWQAGDAWRTGDLKEFPTNPYLGLDDPA